VARAHTPESNCRATWPITTKQANATLGPSNALRSLCVTVVSTSPCLRFGKRPLDVIGAVGSPGSGCSCFFDMFGLGDASGYQDPTNPCNQPPRDLHKLNANARGLRPAQAHTWIERPQHGTATGFAAGPVQRWLAVTWMFSVLGPAEWIAERARQWVDTVR
jgi:hypothetical protein